MSIILVDNGTLKRLYETLDLFVSSHFFGRYFQKVNTNLKKYQVFQARHGPSRESGESGGDQFQK